MNTHGICHLSIVPMRTEPSDKSELCTQLIFGDAYSIIDENEKWFKIKTAFDDYEGWIDKLQHNDISENNFTQYIIQPQAVCYDDVALVEHQHGSQLITLGATLPFLEGRKFTIGNNKYTYEGELYAPTSLVDDGLVKFFALRFSHSPYLWGGKTLFGTDCSGFVQTVYKLLGYKIKRDAYQQAEHGIEVKDINQIKTGDLVFFENDNQRITHVGMVLEENKIIHAHGEVRIDVVDEKGIFNLTKKKYSHKFSKIRRIIS